jgi:rhomboid protease GluP
MSGRSRAGAVVCPACSRLVGAAEARCPFCGHAIRGAFGLAPGLRRLAGTLELGALVMGLCIVLYLAMLAVDPGGLRVAAGGLGILMPSERAFFAFGASGVEPVLRYGRWWTLLSAGWLHGNLLHILFNMLWVRQLAPAVQHLYGPGRSLIIYTAASVVGFAFSTLSYFSPRLLQVVMRGGGGSSVGASAALFGLLAALIHYSRRGGSRALGQQVWSWAIALFVFGLVFPGVDNWAHLGGFLGGWVLSYWFDPLRPERPAHLVAGALCLLASLAAVALSLFTARGLLG